MLRSLGSRSAALEPLGVAARNANSLHPTIQATAAVLSTLASQPGDAILSEVNAGSGADRSDEESAADQSLPALADDEMFVNVSG